MKRGLGLGLIGLGAFLLVVAPLLKWYAYPRLAVVPLDQDRTSVSSGPDATIFDRSTFTEVTTDLTSTRVVKGDVVASEEAGDDVAIWETRVATTTPDGTVINAYTERVPFDRHTGAAVESDEGRYDDEPAQHEGQVFKFPFGTEQRTYDFWDSTIQEARPAEFDGEDEIEGLPVYRFVQVIEPTPYAPPNDTIEVPGSLVDADEQVVTADRLYSNTRTLWVEPETGVIIRGQEEQRNTINYEGEDKIVTTEVTIGFTDETIEANVADYEGDASRLALLRSTGPLVALLLGAVLLVAGLVLVLAGGQYGGRRKRTDGAQPVPPAGTREPAEDQHLSVMRRDDGG